MSILQYHSIRLQYAGSFVYVYMYVFIILITHKKLHSTEFLALPFTTWQFSLLRDLASHTNQL